VKIDCSVDVCVSVNTANRILIFIRWDLQYSNELWTITEVHQEEERQNLIVMHCLK
jgi:hypothetical protein